MLRVSSCRAQGESERSEGSDATRPCLKRECERNLGRVMLEGAVACDKVCQGMERWSSYMDDETAETFSDTDDSHSSDLEDEYLKSQVMRRMKKKEQRRRANNLKRTEAGTEVSAGPVDGRWVMRKWRARRQV